MAGYSNGLFAAPEEIMSDGKNLVSFAEKLMNELNSFQSNKDALMEIWHGESATSFSDAYEEEKKKLSKFQQLLNEKGVALQSSAEILSTAESENVSNASNLGE